MIAELKGAAIGDTLNVLLLELAFRPLSPAEQVPYVFEERRWFSLPVEQVQFKTLWGEFHSVRAENSIASIFRIHFQITIICPRSI